MTDHSTPGLKRIECYGGRWPDPDVPADQPTWIYYEVDTVEDLVLRMVEVFADGRIERNSIALEERKGDSSPSLVDGPIMETVRSVPLDPMTAIEFEKLWQRGKDTPFWFADGFPKAVQF